MSLAADLMGDGDLSLTGDRHNGLGDSGFEGEGRGGGGGVGHFFLDILAVSPTPSGNCFFSPSR